MIFTTQFSHAHCIVFISTHSSNSFAAWFPTAVSRELDEPQRDCANKGCGVGGKISEFYSYLSNFSESDLSKISDSRLL